MTTKVNLPNNGAYNLITSGPCRIQFTGDVYAIYGLEQPSETDVGHIENSNIAYPGNDNVYLKVRGAYRNPDITCIVTTLEV